MKKIIIVLFITAIAGSSCKKSYLDVNQNPNQPTQVTPNVVLSSALVGTASNLAGDYLGLTRWMGYWSRSGNYVPDVQTETYNITNDYTDGEWTALYANLNNYNYIENVARDENLPFYLGVAKAMKALDFSILVDMYGNVPYTQAFEVNTTTTPAYDDAQTIYNDLVSQLDSAFDYFETAKTYYAGAASSIVNTDDQYDVMFGSRLSGADATGRMILWQKFTNTLKLRLLLNQSQVSDQNSFIQEEIAKIKSPDPINEVSPYLEAGQSAIVNPGYQASSGKMNPFFGIFYTVTGSATSNNNYYRANSYAVNFYLTTEDFRQAYVYTGNALAPGSNYDGDPASVPNSSTAGVGPGLTKDFTQDQLILSDFESLFLQAEAVQRGWITGDAQTLYQSAVEQNFVYLYKTYDPVDDPIADADAYLAGELYYDYGIDPEPIGPQPDVAWEATEDKLELILTQKWIAMNGIGWVVAYDDYRRTGFPTTQWLDISHSPTHLQPEIPVRYLYPQVEYNTNPSNVPQLGSGAQFSSNIFWDK